MPQELQSRVHAAHQRGSAISRSTKLTVLGATVILGLCAWFLLNRDNGPDQMARQIVKELDSRSLTTLIENSSKTAAANAKQSPEQMAANASAIAKRIEPWPNGFTVRYVDPNVETTWGKWDVASKRGYLLEYQTRSQRKQQLLTFLRDAEGKWKTNVVRTVLDLLTNCVPDQRGRMTLLKDALEESGQPYVCDGKLLLVRDKIDDFLADRIPFSKVGKAVSLY